MGKFFKTDQKFSDPNSCEKSVYFTDEVKIKIEGVSILKMYLNEYVLNLNRRTNMSMSLKY
jgi:hypothetical protein